MMEGRESKSGFMSCKADRFEESGLISAGDVHSGVNYNCLYNEGLYGDLVL